MLFSDGALLQAEHAGEEVKRAGPAECRGFFWFFFLRGEKRRFLLLLCGAMRGDGMASSRHRYPTIASTRLATCGLLVAFVSLDELAAPVSCAVLPRRVRLTGCRTSLMPQRDRSRTARHPRGMYLSFGLWQGGREGFGLGLVYLDVG